jgi:hypothetical protein
LNPYDVRGVAPAFDPRGTAPGAGAQRHSVLAIAALILASFAALSLFGLLLFVGVAGALEASGSAPLIEDDSPAAVALGLGLFALVGLQLLASGLGIGALFEKDRKRVCAIVALTISAMTMAGAGLILLIGLLTD